MIRSRLSSSVVAYMAAFAVSISAWLLFTTSTHAATNFTVQASADGAPVLRNVGTPGENVAQTVKVLVTMTTLVTDQSQDALYVRVLSRRRKEKPFPLPVSPTTFSATHWDTFTRSGSVITRTGDIFPSVSNGGFASDVFDVFLTDRTKTVAYGGSITVPGRHTIESNIRLTLQPTQVFSGEEVTLSVKLSNTSNGQKEELLRSNPRILFGAFVSGANKGLEGEPRMIRASDFTPSTTDSSETATYTFYPQLKTGEHDTKFSALLVTGGASQLPLPKAYSNMITVQSSPTVCKPLFDNDKSDGTNKVLIVPFYSADTFSTQFLTDARGMINNLFNYKPFSEQVTDDNGATTKDLRDKFTFYYAPNQTESQGFRCNSLAYSKFNDTFRRCMLARVKRYESLCSGMMQNDTIVLDQFFEGGYTLIGTPLVEIGLKGGTNTAQSLAHEWGHSKGNLGDEYYVTDNTPDASHLNCAVSADARWSGWKMLDGQGEGVFKVGKLGSDGKTYEPFLGCYNKTYVRATENSLMNNDVSPVGTDPEAFGKVNQELIRTLLEARLKVDFIYESDTCPAPAQQQKKGSLLQRTLSGLSLSRPKNAKAGVVAGYDSEKPTTVSLYIKDTLQGEALSKKTIHTKDAFQDDGNGKLRMRVKVENYPESKSQLPINIRVMIKVQGGRKDGDIKKNVSRDPGEKNNYTATYVVEDFREPGPKTEVFDYLQTGNNPFVHVAGERKIENVKAHIWVGENAERSDSLIQNNQWPGGKNGDSPVNEKLCDVFRNGFDFLP